MFRYTVETIRSGQPRPYADTEREYRIFVEVKPQYAPEPKEFQPWLQGGDVTEQRLWAKRVIRALCCDFREADDKDGRTGMEAAFYPTLKVLELNPAQGTIHCLIVEAYTD
jgi:hypothetical protein